MCTEISYTGIFQSALCNVYCMFNSFAVCISYFVRLKPLLPLLHTALNNCSLFSVQFTLRLGKHLWTCALCFLLLYFPLLHCLPGFLCATILLMVCCVPFFSSGEQVDFALNVCFSFLSSDSDVVVWYPDSDLRFTFADWSRSLLANCNDLQPCVRVVNELSLFMLFAILSAFCLLSSHMCQDVQSSKLWYRTVFHRTSA